MVKCERYPDERCYLDGVLTSNNMVYMMDCINVGRLEEASCFLEVCNTGDLSRVIAYYGFVELGCGSYSTVIQIPGESAAIKINHNCDDKWWLYAGYAKEVGDANPMLPKVYELHYNQHVDMGIARVEKLTKAGINTVEGMWNVVNALGKDLERGTATKRGIRNNALNYLRSMFDIERKGHYSPINLAKIVIWLTGHIKGDDSVDCDFHGANWMLRGNQLVLNDPIA